MDVEAELGFVLDKPNSCSKSNFNAFRARRELTLMPDFEGKWDLGLALKDGFVVEITSCPNVVLNSDC